MDESEGLQVVVQPCAERDGWSVLRVIYQTGNATHRAQAQAIVAALLPSGCATEGVPPSLIPVEWFRIPIEALSLNPRPYNAIRRAGIVTIGMLAEKSPDDLMRIPNIGGYSLREVQQRLADFRRLPMPPH